MNEWSDAEISRRLALAIGWKAEQMEEGANLNGVLLPGTDGGMWRYFDYRDPAVIWPLAERFAAFPMKSASGNGWVAITDDMWHSGSGSDFVNADTAAKAVALAVIKAKEQT